MSFCELGGELDEQFSMQFAKITFATFDWHAFTFDYVPGEWLGHLVEAAPQNTLMTIQMTYFFLIPEKCILKRNIKVHVEIV